MTDKKKFSSESDKLSEEGALWERLKKNVTPLSKRQKEKYSQKRGLADTKPSVNTHSQERFYTVFDKAEPLNVLKSDTGFQTPVKKKPVQILQNLNHIKDVKTGQVKIDFTLDLHGKTQDQAYQSLKYTLRNISPKGVRCLHVITGKGQRSNKIKNIKPSNEYGILRQNLPKWLDHEEIKKYLYGYSIAHVSHGGSGAYYLFLRRFEKISL